MTLAGKFFSNETQVENVIRLLIVIVLLVLIVAIVISLVVNPASLNVEKNQLIVVVITTVLNSFSTLVFRYFKNKDKEENPEKTEK